MLLRNKNKKNLRTCYVLWFFIFIIVTARPTLTYNESTHIVVRFLKTTLKIDLYAY